jgi:hypothetical protein
VFPWAPDKDCIPQATSLQNLCGIGSLTERDPLCALLHFNAEVVVKHSKIFHLERSCHFLFELLDILAGMPMITRSSTYTSTTSFVLPFHLM